MKVPKECTVSFNCCVLFWAMMDNQINKVVFGFPVCCVEGVAFGYYWRTVQ